jgi:AcrR family transcriptional regulator
MSNKKHDKLIWIIKGLEILSSRGHTDLTIDNLTKLTGLTKGSFYHHFKNRTSYSEQLIVFWKEKNTNTIIRLSEKGLDVPSKLRRLLIQVLKISENTEIAFRSWAMYDELIKKYQYQIDRERLMYLYRLYRELYNDRKKALIKSYKTLYKFIGYQQVKNSKTGKFNRLFISEIFDI